MYRRLTRSCHRIWTVLVRFSEYRLWSLDLTHLVLLFNYALKDINAIFGVFNTGDVRALIELGQVSVSFSRTTAPFSLQEFAKGAESHLPSAKYIPCLLTARKKDKTAEYRATPYEAFQTRSEPFQDLVRTQFADLRDEACLRHMVNLLCQEVWGSFLANCAVWELSGQAASSRRAIAKQVRHSKGARQWNQTGKVG